MTQTMTTDRIEKSVLLSAPRARVWRALTDAGEFGRWFGVKLDDPFERGRTVRGHITIKGYEGVPFEAIVDTLEPERHFSFWWRPYAIDPTVDYSGEPRTLVSFTLEAEGDTTRLTVVESGFDGIPAARREIAFLMNTRGWEGQLRNIAKYVEGAA